MKTENEIKNLNFAVILKTLNMNPGHFLVPGIFLQRLAASFLKRRLKIQPKEYPYNIDEAQQPLKCILFNQD